MQEGGGEPPKGSLGWAIDTNFGSLEALVKKMNAEGAALQGSGWVVGLTSFSWVFVGQLMLLQIKLWIVPFIYLLSLNICLQWLGVDKELKRLVVETTANQVIDACSVYPKLIDS